MCLVHLLAAWKMFGSGAVDRVLEPSDLRQKMTFVLQ